MREKLSLVALNALDNPNYKPYCLRCDRGRMTRIVEPFLWRCDCGAEHDERAAVGEYQYVEMMKARPGYPYNDGAGS